MRSIPTVGREFVGPTQVCVHSRANTKSCVSVANTRRVGIATGVVDPRLIVAAGFGNVWVAQRVPA